MFNPDSRISALERPTPARRTEGAADRGPRNPPSPAAALLHLQRHVGNRSVAEMLGYGRAPSQETGGATRSIQRAPATDAATVAQDLKTLIAGAEWKEIRKRVYPKESAAGIKRADDRKAGKLPDLTGLGQVKTLEHFAAAVRGIQGRWTALAVDDRVKELGRAVNAELAAAEVPGFLIVGKQKVQIKGFFTPSLWSFTISEALVNGGALSDSDAAEVANTALHEARHAEQQFLAARFSAGVNKQNAAGIVAEQGIPQRSPTPRWPRSSTRRPTPGSRRWASRCFRPM